MATVLHMVLTGFKQLKGVLIRKQVEQNVIKWHILE
jgi:hypothetical protein